MAAKRDGIETAGRADEGPVLESAHSHRCAVGPYGDRESIERERLLNTFTSDRNVAWRSTRSEPPPSSPLDGVDRGSAGRFRSAHRR